MATSEHAVYLQTSATISSGLNVNNFRISSHSKNVENSQIVSQVALFQTCLGTVEAHIIEHVHA